VGLSTALLLDPLLQGFYSALFCAGLDNPNGGSAASDLDGAERKQGTHIDIGACERGAEKIFANGFE